MTTKTQEALKALAAHPNRRLMRRHLKAVAGEFLEGKASTAQIAAFLMAVKMTGETGHEVDAFVEVMLEHSTPFIRPKTSEPIVDTCGTGGDGHGTFNISTATALLAAAAGVRVAKHGNRSASSRCGSADVLEQLGYRLDIDPADSARMLESHKFCFLFAPQYHPAMKNAAEARRELRIPTLFNLCGPLANPARPSHQLVGVASADLAEPMAHALRLLGSKGALVVHGADGLDEISLAQVTEGVHLDASGRMHHWHISPSDFGFKPVELAELVGGDAVENASILRRVLSGVQGPHADIVNLNAAAVLWLVGVEQTMQQGLAHAREVQRSGAAARLLDEILESQPGR